MSEKSPIVQLMKMLRGELETVAMQGANASRSARTISLLRLENILHGDSLMMAGMTVAVTRACEVKWPEEVKKMTAAAAAGEKLESLISEADIERTTSEIEPAMNELYMRFMALGFMIYGHLDDMLDLDLVDGKPVLRLRAVDNASPDLEQRLKKKQAAYVKSLQTVLDQGWNPLTATPALTLDLSQPSPVAA